MNKISKIDFLKLGERTLAVVALFLPISAFADLPTPACPTGLNCTTTGANGLIVTVINVMLGVAFLVAVLFLIIGGFRFILSAGNEDSAKAGRKTVINALIGIVIIILSYVIVSVVNKTIGNASTGGSPA